MEYAFSNANTRSSRKRKNDNLPTSKKICSSDVLEAIDMILRSIPIGRGNIPKILFEHQIYGMLPNRTLVNHELAKLCENNILKRIKCDDSIINFCFMKTTDYLNSVETLSDSPSPATSILKKYRYFIMNSNKVSILLDENPKLEDKNLEENDTCSSFSIEEINVLINLGYIIPRRDSVTEQLYWISYPDVSIKIILLLTFKIYIYNLFLILIVT